MNDKDKFFCWVCGSDDPDKIYFKPSTQCIMVLSGQYVCRDCCQNCRFYPVCSAKDSAPWATSDKK